MESQLALNNVLVIGEIEKKSLTKATLEAISAAKSIAKNQVELLLFSSKSYEKDSLISWKIFFSLKNNRGIK